MKKNYLLFLFFFLTYCSFAFGQKTITGTVTDGSTNETIIGAPVKIKNKPGVGVITNIDGQYSISASPTDVLEFGYMGMISQEIAVGDQTVINVTLMPDTKQLDELVVIGYGQVKKSDLTGAVAVVSTEEMAKRTTGSAAQAIQGLAPGVVVVNSGRPGGGSTIRVRGIGSVSGNSNPLIVIDGVVGGALSDLQPNEIENIQVLKDASSSAIYGANGSNGVIIVTTKRGKTGKPTLTLNSFVTYNTAPTKHKLMNADEYVDFYRFYEGDLPAFDPVFREKYYGENWRTGTDWQSLLFRNSWTQNNSLSISGGGEKSNYSISLSYINDEGTIIKNRSQAFNLRANADFQLTNFLKVGENLSIRHTASTTDTHLQTSIWDLYASPLMKVYNPNFKGGYESPQTDYYIDQNGNLQQLFQEGTLYGIKYTNTGRNDKPSPYAEPMILDFGRRNLVVRASVYAQIDFTDWLSFRTMPAAAMDVPKTTIWRPTWTGNRGQSSAVLNEVWERNTTVSIENQLMFNKSFNDTHNVQATVVQTARQELGENINGTQNGFPDEFLNVLSKGGLVGTALTGGRSDYREIGLLGRLIYDYAGKYYLTTSVRRDGVSRFAKNYRTGTFTAASLAWKMNEDFLKDVREIDMLKLRVGWGQTGNTKVGIGLYDYQDNITGNTEISPVFGEDQHIAWAEHVLYGMGSATVSWETAEMLNFGIDLNMWNGKLQSSLEYYIKDVKDLLSRLPVADAFGRANGNPWVNLGTIRNSGFELNATWKDKIGELDYSIMTNVSTVKNRVISLLKSPVIDGPWPLSGTNITSDGRTIGEIYGWVSEGIIQPGDDYANYPQQNNNSPQPGDLKFRDLNGDGVINDKDRTSIGKTIPAVSYSLSLNLAYKNFDFTTFFYGVGDYDVFNYQRTRIAAMNDQDNMHNKLSEYAANYFTLDRPSTEYVRFSSTNLNDRISTFWIEDGSFFRVKDVQLGYNFPKSITNSLYLKNLRLYVNASNPLTITKYKGMDPEPFMNTTPTRSGIDQGGYALPRSFTFGLQLGF